MPIRVTASLLSDQPVYPGPRIPDPRFLSLRFRQVQNQTHYNRPSHHTGCLPFSSLCSSFAPPSTNPKEHGFQESSLRYFFRSLACSSDLTASYRRKCLDSRPGSFPSICSKISQNFSHFPISHTVFRHKRTYLACKGGKTAYCCPSTMKLMGSFPSHFLYEPGKIIPREILQQ